MKRDDGFILARKLVEIQDTLWSKHVSSDLPKKLKSTGSSLESYSNAKQLAKPIETMNTANIFPHQLTETRLEIEKWAKLFAVILDQINSKVEEFTCKNPKELNSDTIEKQFKLIENLLEKIFSCKQQLWQWSDLLTGIQQTETIKAKTGCI